MKARIIEELGQAELMLPNMVAGALKANDRAKLRMSLLQAALHRAHEPHAALPDFATECGNAGIDAVTARALVAGAHIGGDGTIEAPNLSRLSAALLSDIETMIEAVSAGDKPAGDGAARRFAALKAGVDLGTERVAESDIAKVTSVASDGTDSLHRLVMDLHKALNRLTAQCGEETIAGARCYGLGPDDKPLVAAFMRGLERTRGLKFDHPGLDTTVVRGQNRLLIQNDIGTTDAHVLVVSVEGGAVTITHSDVHEPRAKFFVGLFDPFPVKWNRLRQEQAEGLAKGETYYLVTGRYEADNSEALESFLEAIGAALVFLIDWNKARKALRKLVSNSDAVDLLNWAARHEVGHRAFLELGGTDLIATAVRQAAPARIGFGEELGDVLGREATLKFLKTALRLSTEALRQGRSARSVRETLEVDLVRRIERNESALLVTVVRQLGLARDIATAIAADIEDGRYGRTDATSHAGRAKRIEEKADTIALEARRSSSKRKPTPPLPSSSMRPRMPSMNSSRRLSSFRSCRANSREICFSLSASSAPAPFPGPRRRLAASRRQRAWRRAMAATPPTARTRFRPRRVSSISSMPPIAPSEPSRAWCWATAPEGREDWRCLSLPGHWNAPATAWLWLGMSCTTR
jgi:hypothetical protein